MDALLDVVREKNTEKLETAVSEIPGIERIINEPDWNAGGKLFLIEVVKTNQPEYLDLILDSQVLFPLLDVNVRDNHGSTALHHAVKLLNLPMTRTLLKTKGTDVNVRDHLLGQTPLHTLASKLISKSKSEVPSSFFEMLQLLVQHGDVNTKCNQNMDSLLHRFVAGNVHTDLIDIVLAAECDMNIPNASGETPLMMALELDRSAIAEFLIVKGADLFCANQFQETCLHVAARKNHLSCINRMLSSAICPVNVGDIDGNTALHQASARGFKAIVLSLVKIGQAEVNIRNARGETPLHLAVEGGFSDIVEFLVSQTDCDLDAQTSNRLDALAIAQKACRKNLHPTISRILQSAKNNRKDAIIRCAIVK